MRKNMQLISSPVDGDCLRACFTSLLGIENSNDLPNTSVGNGYLAWKKAFDKMGIQLSYRPKDCWQSGYWIASVNSKNYEKGTHAIIMYGSRVWHDPSPKKRYHAGYYLSSKEVTGGYMLVISEPDKFKFDNINALFEEEGVKDE